MKLTRWHSLLLLGALAPSGLAGVETVNSAAGLAFPGVAEAGSARAIALGSTYVGIAEGSASLPWNPAGLAGLCSDELALLTKMMKSRQESAAKVILKYRVDLAVRVPVVHQHDA